MGYGDLPAEEMDQGVRVFRVPAWRKRQATCETVEMLTYVVSAFPKALKLSFLNRYDLIHVHFIVPTGLLAYLVTRFFRVPYLLTMHGSDVPGYNPDRFSWEHRFLGPLLRLILRNAASITSPSRFLAGLLRQNCGSFDVTHVPNGIFMVESVSFPKRDRLLMSGRLLKRKGFHLVLDALKDVDCGDFEIHIAGDGPERSNLEALASEVPAKVVFHGWLDHDDAVLADLLKTSRIFCLVSSQENASIALLEAMAQGMAVVTSNVTGCPETVGNAGIAVPIGDRSCLQATLQKLMKDAELCTHWGLKARKRVESLFDWNSIGDKYLSLFASLAKSPRG